MKLFICMFALVALAVADEENINNALELANSQFTARMFSEVVKENVGKSVVMSAFSVLSPLSQLALASVGESHDEILKTVGFPNDNVTKEVFTNLNRQLRTIKGVELKMANKIYVADGYELNEQFAALSKDVFDSEVKNVDFIKNVETANEINSWVEDHTNHRIKDLVKPDMLGSDTRSVLVNAIYFKGSWKEKFNKEQTSDQDFHVTKDKTIKVPTMYTRGNFKYAESAELNARLLEIPYEGDQSSFLVILPNDIDGLTALEEKLKEPEKYLTRALQQMHTFEVDLYLPKFKIETEINLKSVLEKMDMKRLFNPGEARLNNLLKGASDLYVSDAIQKAFIEVNEEGAEAAVANAFGISYLSAVISEPRKFEANHPYVFILYEQNNPLFTGVYHP